MKWRELKREYESPLEELKLLDPYELLGVSPSDEFQEIKKAYRKMVRRYHPDKADDFMKSYSQEVVKLLNTAIEEIEKQKNDEN